MTGEASWLTLAVVLGGAALIALVAFVMGREKGTRRALVRAARGAPHRLLVPIDFSLASWRAVDYAAGIAAASTRRTLFAWTSTFALATAALCAAVAFALGPTLSRVFMWDAMPATTMFLLGAAIAGATHGFLVGTGQARVLRRRLSRAPSHWALATASGAAIAWTACMVLNLGGVAASLSDRTWHALVVAGGLGFGSVIGVAQWLALRRTLPGAIWWIPANAFAWLLASAVIIAGIPLAERTEPTLASSALVLVTGFVASLVAAVIPGLALAVLATRAERIDAARDSPPFP